MREVRAARRAAIPIQPVLLKDARWDGHEFPPEELQHPLARGALNAKAIPYNRAYHDEFIVKLKKRLGAQRPSLALLSPAAPMRL
jgi:hypothetical protein